MKRLARGAPITSVRCVMDAPAAPCGAPGASMQSMQAITGRAAGEPDLPAHPSWRRARAPLRGRR
jgi:hypothetical protein